MYPKKLKDDSIVEAVCHLQFEPSEVSEIVIGRLSDEQAWETYLRDRLPVADIPAPVRSADTNLRFEPLLQLRAKDGSRLVKIGDRTISYHIVGQYCGWEVFEKELEKVFADLFSKLNAPTIKRIGFRYINALTAHRHFVPGVDGLNLNIEVAGQRVTAPVNLNIRATDSEKHFTLTRIASPEFVNGSLPDGTTVVVDVDVFTPPDFETSHLDQLLEWVKQAHEFEKRAFFSLLPGDVQEKLIEEV